jgi:hypothetical protein
MEAHHIRPAGQSGRAAASRNLDGAPDRAPSRLQDWKVSGIIESSTTVCERKNLIDEKEIAEYS